MPAAGAASSGSGARTPAPAWSAWSSPAATAAAMNASHARAAASSAFKPASTGSAPAPSAGSGSVTPTTVGALTESSTEAPQPATAAVPSPAAAPPAPASPAATPVKAEPELHQRLVVLLLALVGSKVVVTTREGKRYIGILAASSPQHELSVNLRQAQQVDAQGDHIPGEAAKPNMLVASRDLVELYAHDVALDSRTSSFTANSSSNREGFKTDLQVTGTSLGAREKKLQAWAPSGPGEGGGGIEHSISGLSLEDDSASGKGWDQFATNERLYGTRTDYEEEIYTTKLDRTGADFRQREQRAAQLEREILKGGGGALANNTHMAEERGAAFDDSNMNEEDRYSGVIRGPEAYVPPGARKSTPVAKPAVAAPNGASSGSASTPSVSTPAPKPTPHSGAQSQTSFQDPAILSASGSSRLPLPNAPNSRIPSPAASTNATASDKSDAASKATLDGHILRFVSDEREKLNERKQALLKEARETAEKKEKDSKLRSLLEFSQTFKLKGGTPTDLASIIGDLKPAANGNSKTVATVSAAAAKPAAPPAAAAGTPATRESTAPPARNATMSPGKLLPDIPPFNPEKARAAAEAQALSGASKTTAPAKPATAPLRAASAAVPRPLGAPVASTSKLTAAAPAFVFKPNPNASAFTPGASLGAGANRPVAATPSNASVSAVAGPSPAPASISAAVASAAPNHASAQAALHPFFGNKPYKRGHGGLYVKEEFAPFKSGVPDPATVDPRWPFYGKSYRAVYPVSVPTPPPLPLGPHIGMPLVVQSGSVNPEDGGPESSPPVQTSNLGAGGPHGPMRMPNQPPMHLGAAGFGAYPLPHMQPGGFVRFPGPFGHI
ncbi:BQ5605_C003g02341 [Microbotryum silenes-dioicae]|uniref:BQ5605_C003g02341 protein n=1 Tax=Microbotryum silenes-dioicae TaxID=796604 RepID=A0A2X0P4E0_9BASI|nr:BQ5605_C003g02341 [Microbotryum silenes-dioicae]